MKKILIKICGMTDPKLAQMTLQAGADFVGIVLTPLSSRYVEINKAIRIANAIRENGVKPIIAFKDEPIDIIDAVVKKIGECIVQFQAGKRNDTKKLTAAYETISVYPASANRNNNKNTLLMIDNDQPGSGIPFCWE